MRLEDYQHIVPKSIQNLGKIKIHFTAGDVLRARVWRWKHGLFPEVIATVHFSQSEPEVSEVIKILQRIVDDSR